jgi:hypothetical protein
MHEPERQDLTSLDLGGDRFERVVANIMERSQFELRRRAAAPRVTGFSLLDGLLGWSRPALATAAALAAVSLVALSQLDRPTDADGEAAYFLSSSLPVPVQEWLEDGEAPGVGDGFGFVIASREN